MFLLQLLRHQSGVPRHGDNGFSLRRCHRLLLPNQSEGGCVKWPLCPRPVRGCLLSVEKNLFVSCYSAALGLNIHGVGDRLQIQLRGSRVSGPSQGFCGSDPRLHSNPLHHLFLPPLPPQVDFTSCGGFLCIAAVVLMVIGVITAIVLSFQYVRLDSPLVSH